MADQSLIDALKANATATPSQLSPDEFAQHVKTAHPEYENVDNAELTKRVLDKYPEYQSRVTGQNFKSTMGPGPATRLTPKPPDTALGRLVQPVKDFASSAANTLGITADHPSDVLTGPAMAIAHPGLLGESLVNQGKGLIASHVNTAKQGYGEMTSPSSDIPTRIKGGVRMGLSAVPGLGPMVANAADTAAEGNLPAAAGKLSTIALPKLAESAMNYRGSGVKPVEIPPVESASRSLASRLTPSAKEAPGVESSLTNQIDTLKRTAEGGKISKKSGLMDLSKTAEQAAQGDKYLTDIIEPNKDLPIGNTGMTVGDAHARLAEVNDTLHPKYMRGGAGSPSAQAAIGAEQARALEAEANQLRGGISETVGRKMGVDPEYVRGLRKNYEQLKDIGWRADVSDYAHRMGLQDPSLPTSRMGILDRLNSRLFNNPNSAVAKTFNQYEGAPPVEVPGYPLKGPGLLKPSSPRPIVNPESGTNVEIGAKLNPAIETGTEGLNERLGQNSLRRAAEAREAEALRRKQIANANTHGNY